VASHEIKTTEIVWVMKDDHIGSAFLDAGASQFLLENVTGPQDSSSTTTPLPGAPERPVKKVEDGGIRKRRKLEGASVGPDWTNWLAGDSRTVKENSNITVHYESEIVSVKALASESDSGGDAHQRAGCGL